LNRQENAEKEESDLTQRLQGTKTQSDSYRVAQVEDEKVNIWSLLGGEFTNHFEGERLLNRLGNG